MEKKFEKFSQIFAEMMLTGNNANKLRSVYSNRREYTEIINQTLQECIKEYEQQEKMQSSVAKNYKYYPEYFTIDHTWWITNRCSSNKINIYDWFLEIAVEHENDWMDWTYEVAKLDMIKAPLKVVIGYMENRLRGMEKELVYKQFLNLKNISDNEQFGIILLNRNLADSDNPYDIRCYLLTEKEVQKIN